MKNVQPQEAERLSSCIAVRIEHAVYVWLMVTFSSKKKEETKNRNKKRMKKKRGLGLEGY